MANPILNPPLVSHIEKCNTCTFQFNSMKSNPVVIRLLNNMSIIEKSLYCRDQSLNPNSSALERRQAEDALIVDIAKDKLKIDFQQLCFCELIINHYKGDIFDSETADYEYSDSDSDSD